MTPLKQFDKSTSTVTQDRGATYGHPSDNFRNAALLQNVIDQCNDAVLRIPLRMICLKMARLVETPSHIDSWVDIAGYARTAAMVISQRYEENSGSGI